MTTVTEDEPNYTDVICNRLNNFTLRIFHLRFSHYFVKTDLKLKREHYFRLIVCKYCANKIVNIITSKRQLETKGMFYFDVHIFSKCSKFISFTLTQTSLHFYLSDMRYVYWISHYVNSFYILEN